jgi:hypothetical protein
VSDYAFRAEEMFALVEAELTSRYAGTRFVPASTFGDLHGHNEPAVIADMPRKLSAARVDAASDFPSMRVVAMAYYKTPRFKS